MANFHGPTSGVVELPHRMFWQADRRFNLDDPFMLRLWPMLYLPHGVRRDWERQHPSLREARLAAPEQSQPHFEAWLARQEAA
jgi:hypothetical protein